MAELSYGPKSILLAVMGGSLLFPAAPADGAQRKPAIAPLGESLCPATVQVEQKALTVPGGWQAGQSDLPIRLESVAFFDGPPAGGASLKYDREEKQKRDWAAIWTLSPNPRGYWISCGYDRTTVVLSRRLSPKVSTCQVIYERKGRTTAGLPVIKNVSCK